MKMEMSSSETRGRAAPCEEADLSNELAHLSIDKALEPASWL